MADNAGRQLRGSLRDSQTGQFHDDRCIIQDDIAPGAGQCTLRLAAALAPDRVRSQRTCLSASARSLCAAMRAPTLHGYSLAQRPQPCLQARTCFADGPFPPRRRRISPSSSRR